MNKINYFLNHIKRINTIVNNGFQEILKDYMKRHWLLEQTHDTLVNLPTVKEHYANKTETESTFAPASECYKEVKIKIEPGLEYVTKEETLKLIKNVDNKMSDFMKSNNELFNKLLIQVNELKLELSKVSASTTASSRIEKENIKLEIVDDVVNESKIHENENIEQEIEVVEVESKIEELVIDVDEEVEEDIISVETETKDPEEEEEEKEEEEEEEEEEEKEEEESVETETKQDNVEEEEEESVETETKQDNVEEEEEEELIEIEIDDITYCTNNEENGIIYELDKEGNVGKRVGCLKEGDAYFD